MYLLCFFISCGGMESGTPVVLDDGLYCQPPLGDEKPPAAVTRHRGFRERVWKEER